TIGDPKPGERETVQRVAGEKSEALAVLAVILSERRIDGDVLAHQNRQFFLLVEIELVRKNREAVGNGAIEEIWLRKPEENIALDAAELSGKGERLTEAEKIIGLIGKAEE